MAINFSTNPFSTSQPAPAANPNPNQDPNQINAANTPHAAALSSLMAHSNPVNQSTNTYGAPTAMGPAATGTVNPPTNQGQKPINIIPTNGNALQGLNNTATPGFGNQPGGGAPGGNGTTGVTNGNWSGSSVPANQGNGGMGMTDANGYPLSGYGSSADPSMENQIITNSGTGGTAGQGGNGDSLYNKLTGGVGSGASLAPGAAAAITQDQGQQAVKQEATNYLNDIQNRQAPQASNTALYGNQVRQAEAGAPTMQAAQIGDASTYVASQAAIAQAKAAQGKANLMDKYATSDQSQIQNTWTPQQQAQSSLINQLQTQSQGGGPSVSGLQLQQGEQQQVANQMAVAASQRGNTGNAALALRSGADQSQTALNQLQQQQAIARQQEQLNAQGLLGNVSGQAVGQQMQNSQTQANLNQGVNLFNAGNQQQQLLTNNQDLNAMSMANLANNQQTNLANMGATNTGNQFNASALNAAGQFNAGATQQANEYNASNQQAANQANQAMQGTFGTQQGTMNQQTNMQNLAAQLQQAGMNDQEINNMMATQFSSAQAQSQQNLTAQQMINAYYQQQASIQAGRDAAAANINQGYIGMGMGAAGGIGAGIAQAASDESLKDDLGSGNYMYERFMNQMKSPTISSTAPTYKPPVIDKQMSPPPATPMAPPPMQMGPAPGQSNQSYGTQGANQLGSMAGKAIGNAMFNSPGAAAAGQAAGQSAQNAGAMQAALGTSAPSSGALPIPMTGGAGLQSAATADFGANALAPAASLSDAGAAAAADATAAAATDTGAAIAGGAATDTAAAIGGDALAGLAADAAPDALDALGMLALASDKRLKKNVDKPKRMNFNQDDNVQFAMDNADPNTSPKHGYVPMDGDSYFSGKPSPSDYNYYRTPTPINIQSAKEASDKRLKKNVDKPKPPPPPPPKNPNDANPIYDPINSTIGDTPSDETLKKNVDDVNPAFDFGHKLAGLFGMSSTKAANEAAKGAKDAGVDPSIASLIGSHVGKWVGGNANNHANMADAGAAAQGSGQPSDESIQQMLSTIQPHSYNYKNPSDGDGTYVSPMAQELAKTDLGKDMVFKRPQDGKLMVDYGRGLATMLAGQSYLYNKVNELEKKVS